MIIRQYVLNNIIRNWMIENIRGGDTVSQWFAPLSPAMNWAQADHGDPEFRNMSKENEKR